MIAGAAHPAWSAEERDTELTELTLEELMNVEVTTVSRKPERRASAAAALYVLTEKDMRSAGVLSIPDALRLVPGMQVARIDANKWAIGVRGFASRLARSTLVLMDGRSVYTPLFAGTYWEVQDTLIEDLDRIEVIRGPGGTLWGANAVNGVINIITKHARETQGGFLSLQGGNEEHGNVGFRYGGTLGDDVFWRVYGKYFDRDGGFNPNGPSYDDWHMGRGGFRLDWEASQQDAVTFQGDYYDGDAGQQAMIAELTDPPSTRIARRDADLTGGNVLARWRHFVDETSDLQLQAYYDYTFRDEPTFQERRHTWDLDFQHRFALPWAQEITWGLAYRRSTDDTEAVESVRFTPENRALDLYSGFLQDELTLFDGAVHVTVGSKLEHNEFTGFEFQPSGRLMWTPSPRHSLWAAISRAVRTPSRIEDDLQLDVVSPQFGLARVVGTDRFDSEEVIAYEVGYRVQPAHWAFVDLAAFYNSYEDLLSLEPGMPLVEAGDRTVLPFLFANRLHGRSYGVELAADGAAGDWLRLHAAYSVLQIDLERDPGSRDITSEEQEDNSPHHQLSARAKILLPHRLELDGVLRYVDNIAQLGVSSYVTADLRLAHRVSDALEVSVVGRDLIEDQHREFAGGTQVERSVFGQVRWWW